MLAIFFDVEKGGNKPSSFIESLSLELAQNPEAYIIDNEESNDGHHIAKSIVGLKDFLSGIDFSQFYYYPGSLTFPPCTEGLHWLVVNQV